MRDITVLSVGGLAAGHRDKQPFLPFDQCGEKYYTDEVAEKLEAIVNMTKKLMQEIAVIDYKQTA